MGKQLQKSLNLPARSCANPLEERNYTSRGMGLSTVAQGFSPSDPPPSTCTLHFRARESRSQGVHCMKTGRDWVISDEAVTSAAGACASASCLTTCRRIRSQSLRGGIGSRAACDASCWSSFEENGDCNCSIMDYHCDESGCISEAVQDRETWLCQLNSDVGLPNN